MTDIKSAKNELRNKYREKRSSISPEKKAEMNAVICEKLSALASFRYADTILLYYPIHGEADVLPLADAAVRLGKAIAFPRCFGKNNMEYRYVASADELVAGRFNIPEPSPESKLYTRENGGNTVCVVPAVVFDKSGFRLGYGHGYYDRFLSSFKATSIGVTYRELVADAIPHGRYDLTVDVIVTEKGVISPNAR